MSNFDEQKYTEIVEQNAEYRKLLLKAAKCISSMLSFGEFADDVELVKQLEEAAKK